MLVQPTENEMDIFCVIYSGNPDPQISVGICSHIHKTGIGLQAGHTPRRLAGLLWPNLSSGNAFRRVMVVES
jgi:hypothetical protein